MKKLLTTISLAMFLMVGVAGDAEAGDAIFNATIKAVHSGETPSAHDNAQCFFRIENDETWYVIAQGDAAGFNCSIILAAYLSGKKIRFDTVISTRLPGFHEVHFLCMSDKGDY